MVIRVRCSGLAEHRTQGFFIAQAAHSLGEHSRQGKLANAWAIFGFLTQGDGVGHNQLIQDRVIQVLYRIAGQDRVRTVSNNALGAVFFKRLGSIAQGAGGIRAERTRRSCRA